MSTSHHFRLAFFLAFIGFFTALVLAFQADTPSPGIVIKSPHEGTTFFEGQTVTVVVEPTAGLIIDKTFGSIFADIPPQVDAEAPFELSFELPSDARLGSTEIVIVAFDKDNNLYDTSVEIIIASTADPVGMDVRPERILVGAEELDLPQEFRTTILDVYGHFTDGARRNIAQDANFRSLNETVATVDARGLVIARALGRSDIEITYGSFLRIVPVIVGISERRGDVTSDRRVNRDDVEVVEAVVGQPSTGPGDPRDLDEDGMITQTDVEILRGLCTFSGCAYSATQSFRRGDSNADGTLDLSDAVTTLSFLFLGEGKIDCRDSADTNDDGGVDLSDSIYGLQYLFEGGKPPPEPGPHDCGNDPTSDELGCSMYAPCET